MAGQNYFSFRPSDPFHMQLFTDGNEENEKHYYLNVSDSFPRSSYWKQDREQNPRWASEKQVSFDRNRKQCT